MRVKFDVHGVDADDCEQRAAEELARFAGDRHVRTVDVEAHPIVFTLGSGAVLWEASVEAEIA